MMIVWEKCWGKALLLRPKIIIIMEYLCRIFGHYYKPYSFHLNSYIHIVPHRPTLPALCSSFLRSFALVVHLFFASLLPEWLAGNLKRDYMIVMSIILKSVIQMFTLEEAKRKAPAVKQVFGSSSHNNLISAIDKKRGDVSKEKHSNDIDTKGSAVINFRQIKNNQNKNNKEFFQSKLKKNAPEPSKHINLQNVLSNKKTALNEALSDRSLSLKKKEEERKKPKKLVTKVSVNTSSNEDFECNEELEVKAERRTEKKIIAQPTEKAASNERPSQKTMKTKGTENTDAQLEIRQFQLRAGEIDNLAQAENVYFLDLRESSYKVDPLYIQKKQKQLTWLMRAILMDWMMHISYEFKLKRETLHIALTLVDNFFQNTYNLAKSDFQLTGATALFIAAKLEEFEPLSSKEFAKSTKERYTAEDIKAMEVRMTRVLRFKLNPPTLGMWGNKIMQQWDCFLESPYMLQQPFFLAHQPVYFKRIDNDSYRNYRQMMQFLDCAMLDIQTVQYRPKVLVLSLLYLLIGRQTNEFSKKKILNEFPRTSTYFLQDSAFNQMFAFFLRQSFGVQMREILPSVQYLASFFTLSLNYDRPLLQDEQNIENMGLEEYCSYQTYNPSMILTVEKRFRGIYQ